MIVGDGLVFLLHQISFSLFFGGGGGRGSDCELHICNSIMNWKNVFKKIITVFLCSHCRYQKAYASKRTKKENADEDASDNQA